MSETTERAVQTTAQVYRERLAEMEVQLAAERKKVASEYRRGVMEAAEVASEFWRSNVAADSAAHGVDVEIWQELLGYDKWEKKFPQTPSPQPAGKPADTVTLPVEDLRKIEDALAFYSDVKNFGVTVWEDETQDGKCWYEPAEEHGLGEIYGHNDTGDFGIKASDALDVLRQHMQKEGV